jgi:hypothetical protein
MGLGGSGKWQLRVKRRLTFYSDRRFTVAAGVIEAGGIWG